MEEKMKRGFLLLLFSILASSSFGGSISGTVVYTGSMTGTILIAFLEVGATTFDPFSTPYTTRTTPGAYTVTNASLVDGVEYFGIAYMGTGTLFPMPASGNPAGTTTSDVVLSGGVASGVIINLESEGGIGGVISYAGDIADVYLNVYDIFPEFLGGSAVLENVFYLGTYNYFVDHVPSGAKRVEAFADINGNGELDSGEPSAIYDGIYGNMVFVGGGGLVESGIDITIPGTGIIDKPLPHSAKIEAYPNPFNASCLISLSGITGEPVSIGIFDISGKLIKNLGIQSGYAIWDGKDENGKSVPSGTYLVFSKKLGKSLQIILMK